MKHINLKFSLLADYLAFEAWFLQYCETHESDDFMWVWNSPQEAVVLGYGNHAKREVNQEACSKDEIPIFRRCSGGGTVFQSQECLSYTLFFCLEGNDELGSIPKTNNYVMGLLKKTFGTRFSVKGITDLCLDDLKVAGHAQKRLRRYCLFHGVALVDADLSKLSRYLLHPSKEPCYRHRRSHDQFVTTTGFSNAELNHRFMTYFQPDDMPDMTFLNSFYEELPHLKLLQYANSDWILNRGTHSC